MAGLFIGTLLLMADKMADKNIAWNYITFNHACEQWNRDWQRWIKINNQKEPNHPPQKIKTCFDYAPLSLLSDAEGD